MMKFLLLALLVLSSCATTGKFEEILEGWVGKEAKDLTDTWGVPSRTHAFPDGRKMYEYKFKDRHDEGEKKHRYPAGLGVGCRTFFIADRSDVITAWKWEGHDCVAK